MEKIKFYTDTHIARAAVEQLKNKGVDIIHCEEVGLSEVDDPEHLEYAIKEGRVIVSVDADFPRFHTQLLNEGKHHPGIVRVQSRSQGKIGTIVNELLALHEKIESGESTLEDNVHDQLLFIG